MLSRERSSVDTNRAKHLLECVSSATSIIAIFDLFCKSFGIYRSVLSLSYSVYIASSIFLLQVQAAAGASGILTEQQQQQQQPALRKLDFCIRALSRLKDINPIVGSAVSLVLRELANLGIQTPGAGAFQDQHHQHQLQQQQQQGHAAAPSPPQTSYHPHHQQQASSDFRARQGSFSGFGHRLSHHEIMMGNTSESAAAAANAAPRPGFGSPSRTPPGGAAALFHCPPPVREKVGGGVDKIDHHLQHHGISNQVFEAVSSLQPISASFGNVGMQDQQGPGAEYRPF